MLKILGRKDSINVMKVLWACEELNLPFQRVDVGGGFGFQNTPDYLRLNPNGRVPTIDDDGFVLWESNVIVRYLAGTYGSGRLLPQGKARWVGEQWMDWQQTTVLPPMRTVFWQLVRTQAEKRDMAAVQAAHKSLLALWNSCRYRHDEERFAGVERATEARGVTGRRSSERSGKPSLN